MSRPQNRILVATGERDEAERLCRFVSSMKLRASHASSLHRLRALLKRGGAAVVILDLDTLPVDGRVVKEIRDEKPTPRIMALSRRPFHPELKEAMTEHIYACLSKPVNPDEFIYLLKSAVEETGRSAATPNG